MTLHRNGFEGQTDGTAATVANSGASGDAWTSQALNGGALAYSSAQAVSGSLGLLFTPVSGSSCFIDDASFNDTAVVVSDCFFYTGAPSVGMSITQLRTAAGQAASITITTAGKVSAVASSGTALTATNSLVANHWYRFELQVTSDASAGTIGLQYYLDNAGAAVESLTSSALNTRGGAITTIRRGFKDASTGWSTMTFDNVQTQDGSTTPLGVYSAAAPATGSSRLNELYVYHSSAWVDSTLYTYHAGQWLAVQ